MKPRYLNVDCILKSSQPLGDLVSYLMEDIFILWHESNSEGSSIGFETNLYKSKTPQKDIRKFLDLFESLPTILLIQLKSCEEKVFDIGFESGTGQVQLDNLIDAETITRVSQLHFSLGIRIYPVRPSKPKNNMVTKDNHKI